MCDVTFACTRSLDKEFSDPESRNLLQWAPIKILVHPRWLREYEGGVYTLATINMTTNVVYWSYKWLFFSNKQSLSRIVDANIVREYFDNELNLIISCFRVSSQVSANK